MSQPAILYDSLCKICNAEIEYYKKNDPKNIFKYIDIMGLDFEAKNYKLTKQQVHKYFHVIDEKEQILKGPEAFNYIWQKLNKFKPLQQFYKTKLGKKLMTFGYEGFVHIRPYLPRHKNKNCDNGHCEI